MEQEQPDLSVVFPLIDGPGPGLLSARLSFRLSIYWNVGRIKITGARGKHKEQRSRGGPHRGTNEDAAGAAAPEMQENKHYKTLNDFWLFKLVITRVHSGTIWCHLFDSH